MSLFKIWVATALCLSFPLNTGAVGSVATVSKAESKVQLEEMYGKVPLAFEANAGQFDEKVRFLSRGPGYNLFLSPTESQILLIQAPKFPQLDPVDSTAKIKASEVSAPETTQIRMRLQGANASAKSSGMDRTQTKSNYFIGGDASKWRSKIDNFAKVKFEQVYPGIDLVYYGKQRQLEYDFVVQPGADYQKIQMVFEGAESIALNDKGDLVLKTKTGDLSFQIPEIYQEQDGKHIPVAGKFVLQGKDRVGFEVASYDAEKALVIDPTLTYSTYIGGSSHDYGTGIAADASGIYVTGITQSANFPVTSGVYDSSHNGDWDYVVFKLNPATGAYIYSTFLGGSSAENFPSIAIDANGSAYIAGITFSSDFPTTSGAFDTTHNGAWDYTVTKLSPDGSSLVYSTYLGGADQDGEAASTDNILVDASGSAYITGSTLSSNFPTTAGAFDTTHNGGYDAFVSKLSPDGSSLIYSTFLGGTAYEHSRGGMALDGSGSLFVVGVTYSSDYPTTAGAFDTSYNGNYDLAVSKLSADGSSLIYSTYLGGSDNDSTQGSDIAVDASGSAYIVTATTSSDYPITAGAFDTSFNGGYDLAVSKLSADGSSLIYSTYLGGNSDEYLPSIAIDVNGSVYISAMSYYSSNYPTTAGAFDTTHNGAYDFVVTKLNPAGSALDYSTYLGGNFDDYSYGTVYLDGSGDLHITGIACSTNFPTVNPTQANNASCYDMFVSRFSGFSPGVVGTLVFEDSFDLDTSPSLINWNTTAGNVDLITASSWPDYNETGKFIDMDGTGNNANATIETKTTFSLTPGTYILSFELGNNPTGNNALPSNDNKIKVTLGSLVNQTFVAPIGQPTLEPNAITFNVTTTTSAKIVFQELGSPSWNGTILDDVRLVKVGEPLIVNGAPTANAGPNQTVEVTSASGASVTLNGTNSSDPDGDPLSYTWSGSFGTVTGATPTVTLPLGTNTVSLIVNDGTVDSSPATTSVTVQDTTNPTISGPPSITVSTDPSQATAVVSFASPTATDNSGSATITQTSGLPSGSVFPVGVTSNTWSATDASGNTATTGMTVTVVDNEVPTVNAPANVTAEATGPTTTIAIGTATATDNVGPVTISSDAPASFPVGVTTVTWTATDGAGNSSSATQTVTVADTTAPIVTAPASITQEATATLSPVPLGTGLAVDLVDGALTPAPDNAGPYPVGTTAVIWSVVDANGNTGSATQAVTVTDTTAPSLTAPANITTAATGVLTSVSLGTPVANDLVSSTISLGNDAPAGGFPIGTTTVTWTATDGAGNSSTATQTVTIESFVLDLTVKKAKLKKHDGDKDKDGDKDWLQVSGTFSEFANGDGLNFTTESVTITVDGLSWTLPAGSFVQRAKDSDKDSDGKTIWRYKGPKSGLHEVRFDSNGKFKIEVKRMDLSAIPFGTAQSLSIEVGNDLGETTVTFNTGRGKDDDDKGKDKDKDKDKGKKQEKGKGKGKKKAEQKPSKKSEPVKKGKKK